MSQPSQEDIDYAKQLLKVLHKRFSEIEEARIKGEFISSHLTYSCFTLMNSIEIQLNKNKQSEGQQVEKPNEIPVITFQTKK